MPHGTRQVPIRLIDCELLSNSVVSNKVELVHFSLLADVEPISHDEVVKSKVWKKVVIEELKSIEMNHTLDLVTLSKIKKTINMKWVFKVKLNPYGLIS